MGWPVSAPHKRTVWSKAAVASRCPSGLNATLLNPPPALVMILAVVSRWMTASSSPSAAVSAERTPAAMSFWKARTSPPTLFWESMSAASETSRRASAPLRWCTASCRCRSASRRCKIAIPAAASAMTVSTTRPAIAARRRRRNRRCSRRSSLASSYLGLSWIGAARSVTFSRNNAASGSHGASPLTSTYNGSAARTPGWVSTGSAASERSGSNRAPSSSQTRLPPAITNMSRSGPRCSSQWATSLLTHVEAAACGDSTTIR